MPKEKGPSRKRPKQEIETRANEELAKRLQREFQTGAEQARSGQYHYSAFGPLHATFGSLQEYYDSEEAMQAGRDAWRRHGEPSKADGFLYDLRGNIIGTADLRDVPPEWPGSGSLQDLIPRPPQKVTATYVKHEPLALPQWSDSTLRQLVQDITEARRDPA